MKITPAQARALMALDRLNHYPVQVLSPTGAAALCARFPGADIRELFAVAESAKNDQGFGTAEAKWGRDTLFLPDDFFIWTWNSDADDLVFDADDRVISFDAAVALMDDDLREMLNYVAAPCSHQDFFNAYCTVHALKFGADFIVN